MRTFKPVIRSLLDTDLYKFTMWQPFLHSFPGNHAVYRFVCRSRPRYPLASLEREVREQLEHLCTLSFTEEDLAYLGGLRYLKPDFIEFLRIFRFQSRFLSVGSDGERLTIEARGPQIHVMGFEVFVLSIVNELYFRAFARQAAQATGRERLARKIALLAELSSGSGRLAQPRRHPFQFFDFGTRRRFSRTWHEKVVATLARAAPGQFRGTSNVHLARKYGLTPVGTMAHEYLQTFQAVGVQLRHFQKAALEHWVQEYRGDLGIALTDVVGMDAFLADFDLYFAKLFDGLRHDSGDAVLWAEKALAHYERLRIDPHGKRLVFSDALTLKKALSLHERFADRVPCGFGIGTHLTNDLGVPTLDIVMKLVECNGQPVGKLSDAPGKTLCDDRTFLAYFRQVFQHPG